MESAKQTSPLQAIEALESEVRSYVRSFPTVFTKAQGYKLWDVDNNEYIDFFSGAGALNYGHNHPSMKQKLIEYISSDSITHSLDMATEAKERFLTRFNEVVLKPRNMDYKVMFPGPTGTNTVESALKLARKLTGRTNMIHFTNSFHGMTLGALAVTGNTFKRAGAGVPLSHASAMPYDNYFQDGSNTVDYLERYLAGSGSGVDLPAAVIMETVQGEGGINAARFEWMKQVEEVCRRHDVLLIIDDIQAGVGRTGTFFSFEPAGIEPDIICMSKSISGYGLPFAITLLKPEHDIWSPGEHNGTFRGHNLAFVTGTEALELWEKEDFEKNVQEKSKIVFETLEQLAQEFPQLKGTVKGRGFMAGLSCAVDGLAGKICAEAFKRGLIMETAGPDDEVVKLFPLINIDNEGIEQGLERLRASVEACAKHL